MLPRQNFPLSILPHWVDKLQRTFSPWIRLHFCKMNTDNRWKPMSGSSKTAYRKTKIQDNRWGIQLVFQYHVLVLLVPFSSVLTCKSCSFTNKSSFLYWHLPRVCAEDVILKVSSVALTLGRRFVLLSSLTSVNTPFPQLVDIHTSAEQVIPLECQVYREMPLRTAACWGAILLQQEPC